MDLSEQPHPKKRRTQDNLCIICKKRLNVGSDRRNVVLQPKCEGLQTLFDASEQRRDNVYDAIFPIKEAFYQKSILH